MSFGASLNFLDLDIYARRISFFHKGKEKIGSEFGFFLTSLYIIISLLIFLNYFIRTISYTEVTAFDSTIYTNTIPSIEITPENFNLAFGIENPKKVSRFIDESIYYVKAYYYESVKQNGIFINKKKQEIEAIKCSNEIFGKNFSHLLSKDELNNSYCLYNFDLDLKGSYKYDQIGYIKISIFPCINNTKNNYHCKSKEIIDKFFINNHFSILMKDTALSPANFSSPGMPILLNTYTSIDRLMKKDYIVKLAVTEIETDTGIFYDKIKKDKYLKYVKDFDQFYFVESDHFLSGDELLTMTIRLEDNIYFQKRTYRKMSEVFTKTGGYMQILYSIFTLIALLTKKLNVEKRILNSLFYFDVKKRKAILSIEYRKKLDYKLSQTPKDKSIKVTSDTHIITNNLSKNNKNRNINVSNNFIPYLAKKASLHRLKKNEKEKIILSRPKKSITMNNDNNNFFNIINNQNDVSNEGLINILKDNKSNNGLKSTLVNKNKVLLYKDLKKVKEKKENNKEKESNGEKQQMNKIMENFNSEEKDKYTDINLNIFDYYCFCKIPRKKILIELFTFTVKFYKSQLDILNIFNLIILTQIMMKKHSDGKHNFLSRFVELSI